MQRKEKEEGGEIGLKRGLEDSNQTCCDINTALSGNLVRKIRYDYRECEQRDCFSQSNQQLFEAISRWINKVKFLTLARDAESVLLQRGEEVEYIKYKEHVWNEEGGVQEYVLKVTWNLTL